ncbi:putative prophage protein [Streptococcus pneumoniae]|nr:putative prophage protein [Streptococcus pneumoniae]
MQQITEIITNGAISILVILAGVVVRAVKEYLVKKGGEKTIKIVEILAKNAVNAVEQVAAETGYKGDEKLAQARAKIRAELTKYNISMTDKDLDTFVESAVTHGKDDREWISIETDYVQACHRLGCSLIDKYMLTQQATATQPYRMKRIITGGKTQN